MKSDDWQTTPFILPLLLSGLLCGWVAYVAWRRRAVPGAGPFVVLMAALSAWAFVNLVEKSLVNHDLRRPVSLFIYLFVVTVPGAWFVFAARFARQERWLPRHLVLLLLIGPTLVLALAFTNSYHCLVHAHTEMVSDGRFARMAISHGPIFYINAGYNYLLFAGGAVLLLLGVARQPGWTYTRLAVMLGAMLVPVLGNIAYVIRLQPRQLTDLTPVYFAVTGLASAWLLFRVRLFDVLPIARDFVLDCLSDAVFVLDNRSRILDANLVARSLVREPERLRKKRLADVLPDLGQYLPGKPGAKDSAGEIHLAQAGAERYWDMHVLPLDDQGVTIGALVRLTDVTERKRASEARSRLAAIVEETESRFRQLAENIDGVFWMIDARKQEMLFVSPAYEEIWGRSCRSLYEEPRSFLDAVHPEDRPLVAGSIQRQHQGEYTDEEYRVVRPDGSVRWVWDRGFPIKDKDGLVYRVGGIAVDITARKQAEVALKDQAKQLEESDRRKDEFLAMLAHELRNPLAPILTALKLLKHSKEADPSAETARQMMERQVRHLARLVDDLLDVSRITSGKIQLRKGPVLLATVVAQALETSQPLFEARQHQVAVSLPRTPVWLHADASRLAQVFSNLLDNAAKYTLERGHIWLTAEAQDGEAVVRVRDTGVGMSADMLTRAFELFAQGDQSLARSQGGLGIGLTLVRSIVHMHGGSVEALSEGPGKGSEFVVRLPTLKESPSPRQPPQADGRRLPTRRILVVDDNVDAANCLALYLGMSGHEVRTEYDGPTALAAARVYRPDVVLLDIGMPNMDGYEVARRMRQELGPEKLLLVALTGYGQDEDRRRSREATIDHHLVKPVDPEALQAFLASESATR